MQQILFVPVCKIRPAHAFPEERIPGKNPVPQLQAYAPGRMARGMYGLERHAHPFNSIIIFQ